MSKSYSLEDLDCVVYGTLLSYLSDVPTARLVRVSKCCLAGVSTHTSRKEYWITRLADHFSLSYDDITATLGINARQFYIDATRAGVSKPIITRYLTGKSDTHDVREIFTRSSQQQLMGILRVVVNDKRLCSTNHNRSLACAASMGKLSVVQLLLEVGKANPSSGSNYAICRASANGHVDVVKLLLQDRRVDPSDNFNSSLKYAFLGEHIEVMRLLLKDSRVDSSMDEDFILRTASKVGWTEVVELLLDYSRTNPATHKNYSIRIACENGHADIVKLLLARREVDPSACENHAIRLASQNGHAEVVRLLLADKRVNPTARRHYALRKAVLNDHVEAARLLVADSRTTHIPEYIRVKLAQHACFSNNREMVLLLRSVFD